MKKSPISRKRNKYMTKSITVASLILIVLVLNSCNNTIQLTENKVNWNRGKVLSYIEFDVDSVSEIYKQNYLFDEKGREIGITTYAYGNLVEKSNYYSYNQNYCTFIDSVANQRVFVSIEYLDNSIDNKIKTKTVYKEDGHTVIYQENYLYDINRREIGYSNSGHVSFIYNDKNYTYNDNECTYYRDAFSDNKLISSNKYKITFYDKSYNKDKLTSRIIYDLHENEQSKNIYTYDSLGRENGFKSYDNKGILVREYKNYSYNDNECIYYDFRTDYGYYYFFTIVQKKKIVYFKN
ncbi:MAG: hypothetical protein PHT07_15805 [Paludibacter sp.]|nr:hypothetical protein [Paludibacter sp.]